ncbi:MAG: glycosyltransferase [Kofleriaceae bacterium]|nr:glycosyltransferase [Kofleriaceae bacterium]
MTQPRARVALLIDSLGSGGAQRQLVELAVRLRERAVVEPTVVSYHRDDFFRWRLDAAGVATIRVERSSRLDPGFPVRLARVLERVDLAHAFLLTPALWALAACKISARHGPALIAAERNSLIGESLRQRFLQTLAYRGADAVTANVADVRDRIVDRLGVPSDRVHYVPNGIDLDTWDRSALADCEIPIAGDALHFALVGGLRPQKNHALLFESLRAVPEPIRRHWKVWCVGGETAGSNAAEAVRAQLRASGLGDVVQLVPPVRNVAALLARVDAVLLTSHYEGFPNVLLEAHASRRPVVTTRVGDVERLVVAGKSGFVVEPNAAAFSAAMMRVAALAPADRAHMGEVGRASVEAQFSIAAVAARYERIYADVLRARRSG